MKRSIIAVIVISLLCATVFSACGRSGIPADPSRREGADVAGEAAASSAEETPSGEEAPEETPVPVVTAEPTGTPEPVETPEPTPEPLPEAEGFKSMPESFLIYISGIDVHGELDTVSRSDVNLLAAVNRITGKIQMVNTPRDYYVLLPGSGGMRDKLTHAGIYGVAESKGAMENLYGIPVDYYVRLNFSGFEEIIDALGGIDVYSEYEFDVEPDKHYSQGMNHLNGEEALAFVRERKSFSAGDVQRGRNQMEMLKAIISRMTSMTAVQNFEELYGVIARDLETDLDKDAMFSLIATQLLRGTNWDMETYYVTGTDGSEETYSMPGMNAYVMIPNEDEVAEGTEKMKAVLEARTP